MTSARELSTGNDPEQLIRDFTGANGFLSNFSPHPVTLRDVTYKTAEHAFNALKTTDPEQRDSVMSAGSPAQAKRAGRRVTLRPDWDESVRYKVMDAVVAAKFTTPDLRDKLIATGDALLIEGTGGLGRAWCDQHWGDCQCPKHWSAPGANHLGRTLMATRAQLRGDMERWTRVAVTGHRPQSMSHTQRIFAQDELRRLAGKLRDQHDTTTGISGMALGSDTYWSTAVLDAGLNLWAYIPYPDQPEPWEPADQDTWRTHVDAAARRFYIADQYAVRHLFARNAYMIRDADAVIAVIDPAATKGGTVDAVKKARAAGKTIITVDIINRRTTIRRPQNN